VRFRLAAEEQVAPADQHRRCPDPDRDIGRCAIGSILIHGVSDKVLIQQFKDLEAHRVLARTEYREVPPRVDYALTPVLATTSIRASRSRAVVMVKASKH
jgi:hypothetical protein